MLSLDDGVEIVANPEGLKGLAEICLQLAALPRMTQLAKKLGVGEIPRRAGVPCLSILVKVEIVVQSEISQLSR